MTSLKRITSHPPDVTVVVGTGDDAQEFQCYGVLLAAASPVLDAMLSSGMTESENKRIVFPEKDSVVWQLFLKCIDTERAFLYSYYDDGGFYNMDEEASLEEMARIILNESNVRSIVPLFHELQMNEYLKRCDNILVRLLKIPLNGAIMNQEVRSSSFYHFLLLTGSKTHGNASRFILNYSSNDSVGG